MILNFLKVHEEEKNSSTFLQPHCPKEEENLKIYIFIVVYRK